MPQFGDLQLLMRDEGLIVRCASAGDRQFRLDLQRPSRRVDAGASRNKQRRLQRVDIVGQCCKISVHDSK